MPHYVKSLQLAKQIEKPKRTNVHAEELLKNLRWRRRGLHRQHMFDRLLKEGHEVTVIDNLSSGQTGNIAPAHLIRIVIIERKRIRIR